VTVTNQHHIFLDVGTTNARAWLVDGTQILARTNASVGVRDTARDGSNDRLKESLRDMIDSLVSRDSAARPSLVIGAGMISSALGLAEVPHVPAPAGLGEIAAAIRTFSFPDVTPLPVLLVPGVRTGARQGDTGIDEIDIMRGEETICLGLITLGQLRPPATVLNLGSHWKAIQVDSQNRVAGSVTSLSGEMIHAIQSETILASAVQQGKPSKIDNDWVQQGMAEQRNAGLARAMFCVRLLEQARQGTLVRRMSFLLGAFIAADLDALLKKNIFVPEQSVVIVGPTPLARAWQSALAVSNIPATISAEATTEAATVNGLHTLATHHWHLATDH
jgi:2-dehydro-3-deoxygalactonokinase